jgi:hypothetical protein
VTSEPFRYDADLCVQSWLSYVKQDITSIVEWRRSRNLYLSLAEVYPTSVLENVITTTWTTTAAIWQPAISQCDGYPRVTSVGKTTTTITESGTVQTPFSDRPLPSPPTEPNPWYRKFPPFPDCGFLPEACQANWDKFQTGFSNWTIPLKDVAPEDALCTDRIRGQICPDQDETILEISSWVAFRAYPAVRGFFGQCPLPESACLVKWQTFESILGERFPVGIGRGPMKKGVEPGCDVTVERFALIHFPTLSNRNRNLCNNSTFAAQEGNVSNSMNADISTATLQSIVFEAKSSLFGYARSRMVDQGFDEPETSMQYIPLWRIAS